MILPFCSGVSQCLPWSSMMPIACWRLTVGRTSCYKHCIVDRLNVFSFSLCNITYIQLPNQISSAADHDWPLLDHLWHPLYQRIISEILSLATKSFLGVTLTHLSSLLLFTLLLFQHNKFLACEYVSINPSSEHLLTPYCMSDTILGAGKRMVNKRSGSLLSWSLPKQAINEKLSVRCMYDNDNKGNGIVSAGTRGLI